MMKYELIQKDKSLEIHMYTNVFCATSGTRRTSRRRSCVHSNSSCLHILCRQYVTLCTF